MDFDDYNKRFDYSRYVPLHSRILVVELKDEVSIHKNSIINNASNCSLSIQWSSPALLHAHFASLSADVTFQCERIVPYCTSKYRQRVTPSKTAALMRAVPGTPKLTYKLLRSRYLTARYTTASFMRGTDREPHRKCHIRWLRCSMLHHQIHQYSTLSFFISSKVHYTILNCIRFIQTCICTTSVYGIKLHGKRCISLSSTTKIHPILLDSLI